MANLSSEDKEFLEQCEEELKDRYTENDKDFMDVFNAEAADPPIIDNWWGFENYGHRGRGTKRRYDHSNNKNSYRNNEGRGYQHRGYQDRGYQDRNYEERGSQYRGYGNYTKRGRR